MILVKRAMKSFVSENSLAEYKNFPLCLVVGRATADELERERLDCIGNLVFL